MVVRMIPAGAEAALAAITALVNTGGPGKLAVYAGTRPAIADDITTQELLAEFTLQQPAFDPPFSNPLYGSAVSCRSLPALEAVGTGQASFYRVYDGEGAVVWDGTVSLGSGNGDLIVSTLSVVEGVLISVVSFTLSLPN